MGTNNEPTWRGAAGGAPRAAKKVGWKEEDPKSASGAGKRRAKMLFLGLGGAAAVAGIVWLILLLMAGKRPGLVVIAADPTYDANKGIARLDVPYDPYGWLSAQRLLDWAGKVAKDDNTPKALGDKPFWLDEQLDDWADQVGKDSNVDPVIIYVGLHGGVNRAGDPILYVGRDADRKAGGIAIEADRPAVQLSAVLDKLDERAGKKRKLLVLDTGRALPDPNLGEVSSDFAQAVKKKLAARIAKTPTLAVMLAADEGQRAWDSADLGMTALSYHLMKSLSEGAGRENMASFRADELFASVKREVEQWSKNNRPTPQVPHLIPSPDEWEADAERKARYAERLFYKPTNAVPPLGEVSPAAPMKATADLKAEWQTAATLAARVPAPAAYTPAAWRRYRELLLRYERATMAGDAKGAATLRGSLDGTRKDIERGLDLKLDATGYLLPLAAGVGLPTPTADAADNVTRAASLADAAKSARAALNGATQVPVELHLPIMLQHYVKDVLAGEKENPLAATWKPAVMTRRMAEQAALGVRPGDVGLPYSERVWPEVAKGVQDGDASRRRGEDRMLGPVEGAAAAATAFGEAVTKYRAAFETARQYQVPLRLRDRVFADLPFLTRWLTEIDDRKAAAKANGTVRELWAEALVLADRLDPRPDRPFDAGATEKTAANVTAKYDELLALVTTTKDTPLADTQSTWQLIEHLLLLPPPLVSVADRGRLVERAREISDKFNKGSAEVAGNPPPVEEKVVRRVKAAAESLGGEWARWVVVQKELGEVRGNLNPGDKDLFERASDTSASLAAHRGRQADFKKYPTGGAVEWAQAELFSRLAAPQAQMAGFEPAAVNAQARWKDLLEGQAARVALDHWYDENGQPYFSTKVAKALLDDAEKVAQMLPEERRKKTDDATKAARLALAPPLRLEAADGTDGTIRWTTENDRTLRYKIEPTPYKTPDDGGKTPAYAVPGEAVLFWQATEPDLLTVNAPPRQLVDLSQPGGDGRPLAVTTGKNIDTAAKEVKTAVIKAAGYFRGQRGDLKRETTVRINRRPDLVVSDIRPERGAVLAVRADKDFDPGAVSILLDFSGSMQDPWKKPKVSKKDEIVAILEDLLRDLPRGTDLTVRVFHDNPGFADKKSTLVFPGDFGNKNFRDVLTGANGIIDKIKGIEAKGATPLVPTMKDAIADIQADYLGVKTVIVLTDGADTTRQTDVFTEAELKAGVVGAKEMAAAKKQKLIDLVRKDVEAIKRDDVSVHMVIFGTDKEDEELGEAMFKKVEEWETPGRVYRAEDPASLKRELEAALRPKPRLLMKNGTPIPPDEGRRIFIPKNGLPTNRSEQTDGELRWWGFVPPDLYDLKYFRSKQGMTFAPGDAVCVRLEKGGRGLVRFRRELYYRDIVDMTRMAGRADNGNDDWYLSAPEFAWRNSNWNYLVTTVALEEKRALDVGLNGDLGQVRPRFVWWELTRQGGTGEERFPGTVTVHNLEGHHAPSWRVVGDNGSNPIDANYRVRGWPIYADAPTVSAQPVRVGAAELKAGTARQLPPGAVTAEATIRATIETLPFVADPSVNRRLPADVAGRDQQCLVIRVDDKKGRLLQVRVPQLDVAVKEHRYFYDKDDKNPLRPKVAGYTAVLGPISEDAVRRLAELEINLASVTDVLADPTRPPLMLDMKNPSKTERDLNPVEPLTEMRK